MMNPNRNECAEGALIVKRSFPGSKEGRGGPWSQQIPPKGFQV